MTNSQLRLLLARQGVEIQEGYNYAVYSIRLGSRSVDDVARVLQQNKEHFERAYEARTGDPIRLLPFVCLRRKLSVTIPLPFSASLNVVTEVLQEMTELHGVHLPWWS